MDEVTAVHLYDADHAAAVELARQAGDKVEVCHYQLDSLLSAADVPWWLACLRNDECPAVLLEAAGAGKSVFAEKPIGRSAAEVEPVVAAFRQAGLSLGVAFTNRYRPAAVQARQLIAEGRLGRITAAETRLHTSQVALRDPAHWLFDNAVSGGGILAWLGCHYLDLLRFILGQEVVSVTAQVDTLSGEDIDVEDVAVLTLRFASGALATATFGYLMPVSPPGYHRGAYDTYLGVKGVAGQISWEVFGPDQRLIATSACDDWAAAPQREFCFHEAPADAYGGRSGLEFARDCLRSAQEGTDPPATGEDLLAVWRIIDAAYESSREGKQVELGDDGGTEPDSLSTR
jgi:predicted dehydrogenase